MRPPPPQPSPLPLSSSLLRRPSSPPSRLGSSALSPLATFPSGPATSKAAVEEKRSAAGAAPLSYRASSPASRLGSSAVSLFPTAGASNTSTTYTSTLLPSPRASLHRPSSPTSRLRYAVSPLTAPARALSTSPRPPLDLRAREAEAPYVSLFQRGSSSPTATSALLRPSSALDR
jgi:hypothetical protein